MRLQRRASGADESEFLRPVAFVEVPALCERVGLGLPTTQFTVDTFPPMFRQMCESLSPDGPEHFPVFFEKAKSLFLAPGVPLEQLGDVQSQTLVLIGDDDRVTPEHAAAMVRELPEGSQLAVVPGTSHGLPYEKPDLMNRLILDFLEPQQVQKMIGGPAKNS